MKLTALTTLLLGTAATLTHAIPAPVAGPEGMIDLVSWGASVVGKELAGVAGEGAGTMGGWRWEDCGEPSHASLSKGKDTEFRKPRTHDRRGVRGLSYT